MEKPKCMNCKVELIEETARFIDGKALCYDCFQNHVAQDKLDKLYDKLPKDEKIRKIVSEIVELEIELEAKCNQ